MGGGGPRGEEEAEAALEAGFFFSLGREVADEPGAVEAARVAAGEATDLAAGEATGLAAVVVVVVVVAEMAAVEAAKLATVETTKGDAEVVADEPDVVETVGLATVEAAGLATGSEVSIASSSLLSLPDFLPLDLRIRTPSEPITIEPAEM